MAFLQPKILSVQPEQNYHILVTFETGEQNMIGNWYGRLRDAAYFNQVRVLLDGYGIEWPDGQDIAPHELYRNGKEERP